MMKCSKMPDNDVYQRISWNMFSSGLWLVESRKFVSSEPMGESHIPSWHKPNAADWLYSPAQLAAGDE